MPMREGWERVSFSSVATKAGLVGGPFGSNLGRRDYVAVGVPVLRGQNLSSGRFVSFDDCVFVTEDKAETELARNTALPGDLIFTQRGTLGQVAVVPDAQYPRAVVSQSQMRLRVDPARADPMFVFYYATSAAFLRDLDNRAIVGGVPHINLGILGEMALPLPPIDEQRWIAGVLGALDDLIETNERLACLLVALSERSVAAADRESVTVDDVARFENNRRIPLSAAERRANPGCYPYFGATGPMDTVGDFLFDGLRILVGEDGSVVHSDGTPFVQMAWGRYWVNNHAHVLVGKEISSDVLRVALRAANVAPVVTGAVQAKLSMRSLKSVELEVPTSTDLQELVGTLGAMERSLIDETSELRRTRDELLPLLMSGAVSPGGVEVAS